MRALIAVVVASVVVLFVPRAGAQGADEGGSSVPFAPMAHVERAGSGPTELVLIPDLWCDWSVWAGFMDRNEERYSMAAVTLPGMCGTAPPATPQERVLVDNDRIMTPWLDNAVLAVLDAIEQEGLERPVIVGHGMGALIGFRLSSEYPGRIGGHVAVDGAPSTLMYTSPLPIAERTEIVRGRLLRTFAGLDGDAWQARVRDQILPGVTDESRANAILERSARTNFEVGSRYFIEYYGSDETDSVRGSFVPTLVIAAAGDIPVRRVRGLDRLRRTWYSHLDGMRDLELVFLPASRHFVMDDAPDRLDELVASFAERVSDADKSRASRSGDARGD